MMVFVRIGVGIVALLLCVATLTDLSAWRSGRPIRGVDHEAAARPGGRHRPSCAGTRRSAAMWVRSRRPWRPEGRGQGRPVTEPARLILDALSDLRIHTLKCEAPLNGRLVCGPPEGAFDVPSLAYDLDTAETSAQSVDKDGRFTGPYFHRSSLP